MKKSLTAALAALTFGGAVAATAAPGQARDHYYGGGGYYGGRDYDRHRGNSTGTAIAAGALGLALGAALSSSNHNGGSSYYRGGYASSGSYYGNGYYGDSYYSRPRYVERICESQRWVWDPYIRDNVLVRSTYRC